MSNNTSVSGITSPTQYTLLDNNHKYLPRNFTFIPTVSSESNVNDITKTVKNALDNTYYYTCTPQDFVYKIDVNNDLKDVVYKVDNKSACVYKISSGGNDVYKYCEGFDNVDINVLGDARINIGNVTVEKDEDVLTPLVSENSPIQEKRIAVPKGYNSLEINSSDVYFRKENNNDEPSWVNINKNDDKKIVLFSNNISPSSNIINFFDNNFEIVLNDRYFFDSMIEEGLVNANNKLEEYKSHQNETLLIGALGNEISALVKTALDAGAFLGDTKDTLNSAASALKKASDLSSAASDLSSAASDLNSATNALNRAAPDLRSAALDLSSAASALKKASNLSSAERALNSALYSILGFSITLKKSKLFPNRLWIKEDSVDEGDENSLNTIKDNLISYAEGLSDEENFKKLASTYAIYNNDNIGLADFSTGNVVVTGSPVLKGIFKYKGLDLSDIKSIKMFALDNENKMIIYKNSDNSYNLVYLENNGQNGNRILPEGDSFIPTTNPTEP